VIPIRIAVILENPPSEMFGKSSEEEERDIKEFRERAIKAIRSTLVGLGRSWPI